MIRLKDLIEADRPKWAKLLEQLTLKGYEAYSPGQGYIQYKKDGDASSELLTFRAGLGGVLGEHYLRDVEVDWKIGSDWTSMPIATFCEQVGIRLEGIAPGRPVELYDDKKEFALAR